MTQDRQYRPDIDGLRAFSIIAVVVYHGFPSLLPGGFVGVDIFFVISGYLITGIILREQRAGGFSFAHFYRRRIQRIFPATLLVLAASLAAGWWILLPLEYARLGKHVAAGAGFVPNIGYWMEAGYFDTNSKLKPLLHLWSLGVEEQFYLFWPALALFAARGRHALAVTTAVLLASFIAGVTSADQASAFFLPWNRIWELLAGGVLAALPAGLAVRGRAAQLLSITGIALMIAATLVINHDASFPRWWALLPVTGAAAMVWAGPGGFANRVLALQPLVFIGRISFPLYLWHWPLLTFARVMESGAPEAWIRACAIALAVLLAWLTWRLVERPLRYHPSPVVPAALVVGMLACAIAGLAIRETGGVASRTTEQNAQAEMLRRPEARTSNWEECTEAYAVPGRCLDNRKPPRIAVLGDSHSTNVFYALVHRFPDTGIVRLGRGGCPPLAGVAVSDHGAPDICLDTIAGNLDWVLANPDIETVFLSSMGPMYLVWPRGRFQMRYHLDPAITDNAEIFRLALADTVGRLLKAGKQVVLVVDWPGLGMDPARCVDIRPLRLTHFTPADCRLPRAHHKRRAMEYETILGDIAQQYPEVRLWDTTPVFCDREYCHGMRGDTLLYRDPGHLSLEGSYLLGEHLTLSRPGPAG